MADGFISETSLPASRHTLQGILKKGLHELFQLEQDNSEDKDLIDAESKSKEGMMISIWILSSTCNYELDANVDITSDFVRHGHN